MSHDGKKLTNLYRKRNDKILTQKCLGWNETFKNRSMLGSSKPDCIHMHDMKKIKKSFIMKTSDIVSPR